MDKPGQHWKQKRKSENQNLPMQGQLEFMSTRMRQRYLKLACRSSVVFVFLNRNVSVPCVRDHQGGPVEPSAHPLFDRRTRSNSCWHVVGGLPHGDTTDPAAEVRIGLAPSCLTIKLWNMRFYINPPPCERGLQIRWIILILTHILFFYYNENGWSRKCEN